MSITTISAAALLVALPVGVLGGVAAAHADARADLAPSSSITSAARPASTTESTPSAAINARTSTTSPVSGKVFTISGSFSEQGKPAARHTVEVQAEQSNGKFTTLTGARELTNAQGNYTMRVILGTKGPRELRVVGLGQGTQSNATKLVALNVR